MKKRQMRGIALITAAGILISGCTKIPDYSEESSDITESNSEIPDSSSKKDEYSPKEFAVQKQDFVTKLNAEGGVTDGVTRGDGDFDGKGYIRMNEGNSLTHIINANTTEHYRIILAARSEKGASIKFSPAKKTAGAFYIPQNEIDEEGNSDRSFKLYAVDNVYLEAGPNVVYFTVESGSVDIDYLIVESSDKVSADCYKTGTAVVNPSAGMEAVGVMRYLTEIYGKSILTAQNVSVGTNAEIDAVYSVTERYPAIRQSELAGAVLVDNETAQTALDTDFELAKEWSEKGGIVAYTWHWYSPNARRDTASDSFDLGEALDVINLDQVALMDKDDIDSFVKNGFLSANASALISDIDTLAEKLKILDENKIPLLFEPIPDGEAGLYWWGTVEGDYVKLWQLIFNRLCRYHKLSNLIFVWNGSSSDYYPGNQYCDIIGQSFYENTNNSFAGRFSALANAFPVRKPLAVTACDVLPSVDYLNRDNALWLWCGIGSGKFVIDETGKPSEKYNSSESLKIMYNNTLCVTRDELPDVKNYAKGE